jgi:mannose-6-phosphate isomerase
MYPLLLKPAVKDYLWGGQKLKTVYKIETELEKAAEAWVLSNHPNGPSTVQNGELAGMTLGKALAAWGQQPPEILVKLIDACDRLSLQVHPDDAYAKEHHASLGKTEMWYVLDAEPGATLICGFEKEITTEEFAAHIAAGTPEQVVCHVPVKPGDVFFISPGTVHAIGAGILLAEVQQNSDITYRVWDWGRVGADGKGRPLHVEQALAVSQTLPYPIDHARDMGEQIEGGTLRTLASCPYFDTRAMSLNGTVSLPCDVRCVLCTGGAATLSCNGCEDISLAPASTVYIPQGLAVTIRGQAELLWIK